MEPVKIFELAEIDDFSAEQARINSQKCLGVAFKLEFINSEESKRALSLAAIFEKSAIVHGF